MISYHFLCPMVDAVFNLAVDIEALNTTAQRSCRYATVDIKSAIWEFMGLREPRGISYNVKAKRASYHGLWEDKILRCKRDASLDPVSSILYSLNREQGCSKVQMSRVQLPFFLPEDTPEIVQNPLKTIRLEFGESRGPVSVNVNIVAHRGKLYTAALYGPLELTQEEKNNLGTRLLESEWFGPSAFLTEFKEVCPVSGEQRTVAYASMFVRDFDVTHDEQGRLKIVAVDSYDYHSYIGVFDSSTAAFNLFKWQGFVHSMRFITPSTILFMKTMRGKAASPMTYVQSFFHHMSGVEPGECVLLRLPDHRGNPPEQIAMLQTQLGFSSLFDPYYYIVNRADVRLQGRACIGEERFKLIKILY
ncbi:hypothetical protein FOZ61_008747 [Perkinsus olseni]|uniref:Uncharacterized protein n=2 Tax=Perkinsus olseni TaxID=32597 RepID=A0A7J6L2M1_PEROL|nr:hypothetical protein FOZ61_008747 [Perkinsus olseni]